MSITLHTRFVTFTCWIRPESDKVDGVELGLLHDGYRMVRVGTRAGAEVRTLLHAVRTGDETSFLAALRGVFDSVAGDHGTMPLSDSA